MPHTVLVEHSTAMAKATGDVYAEVSRLRASGIPAPAMAILNTLEGALARIAERNAAMGDVAQSLSDDAAVDTGSVKGGADAGKVSGKVG